MFLLFGFQIRVAPIFCCVYLIGIVKSLVMTSLSYLSLTSSNGSGWSI